MTRIEAHSKAPVEGAKLDKGKLDKDTSDAMDEIEGPLEDDDDEFDDANEPEGDPAKNVPSA